jgi:hypothetical protein
VALGKRKEEVMPEHSPEPWRQDGSILGDAHQLTTFIVSSGDDPTIFVSSYCPTAEEVAQYDANVARIVACVNACRGLNPEVVPELVGMLEQLLENAEGSVDTGHEGGWKSDQFKQSIESAKELLARVKG